MYLLCRAFLPWVRAGSDWIQAKMVLQTSDVMSMCVCGGGGGACVCIGDRPHMCMHVRIGHTQNVRGCEHSVICTLFANLLLFTNQTSSKDIARETDTSIYKFRSDHDPFPLHHYSHSELLLKALAWYLHTDYTTRVNSLLSNTDPRAGLVTAYSN